MTRSIERVVLDTNVLVSRLLSPTATPARAVTVSFERYAVVASPFILRELADVTSRPKFRRYLDQRMVGGAISELSRSVVMVLPTTRVDVCRDPDDNEVLALLLDSRATTLVTGDRDLLALDPFEGRRILDPRQFLDRVGF